MIIQCVLPRSEMAFTFELKEKSLGAFSLRKKSFFLLVLEFLFVQLFVELFVDVAVLDTASSIYQLFNFRIKALHKV